MDFEERFPELHGGRLLPVKECFYTIQGEGRNTGMAAYFIRLGGCDLHCKWCDAKDTWKADSSEAVPVEEIVSQIDTSVVRNAVITGGEPLRYPLGHLCGLLKGSGIGTFLETSGTEPLSGYFDWICVSPKKQRPPRKDLLSKASELKVVIADESDFAWAEANRDCVRPGTLLYLQPEWSVLRQMAATVIDYIKSHPEWRLSLQTHKYLNIP